MTKMKWKVPYVNPHLQFHNLEGKLIAEFKRVMNHGDFILREDVKKFEENMASYLGVRNVIGVNSGTDALYLSIEVLGIRPGDEVITVANSFIATVASIVKRGAKPIFVDICDDFNIDVDKIEEKITNKTKAILPVHLNGRCCRMDKVKNIAKKYRLEIIEDTAQALGAMYHNKKAGSFGTIGCFSSHPLKILSCAGDGGFISTDNDKLAKKLRILRDHGQKTKTDLILFGYNSRLDNLQAAILNIKFQYLNEYIHRRRKIASIYSEKLREFPIILPPEPSEEVFFDSYNSYVIRSKNRNELINHLRSKSIEAFVHIPKPLYKYQKLGLGDISLLKNERICDENLSLPIYPEMNNKQVDYVIDSIHKFFKESN